MADIVTTQTISDTSGVKYVTKITNFSDGTGETLVKKVDASELTFMTEDGNGKSGVELIWSGVTNSTALFLSGQGHFDFRPAGDEISNNSITPTGDVLLSTKNFANGDNYTIIVEFR